MKPSDVNGQFMIGRDADGVAKVALMDEDGRILTSGGGSAGTSAVEGTKSPEADLYYSSDFIRVISSLFAWDGEKYRRLNQNNDRLCVEVEGTVETDVAQPAGSSGTVGWLSSIWKILNSLLANKRSSVSSAHGSIVAAEVSQVVSASSGSRTMLMLQNVSDGDLWYNFNGASVIGQTFKLAPGEKIVITDNVPNGSVTIIGATVGQKFAYAAGFLV